MFKNIFFTTINMSWFVLFLDTDDSTSVTKCVDARWPWWLFDFSVRREQWKHFNPTNSFYPENILNYSPAAERASLVVFVTGGPMTRLPTVHQAEVLSSYLFRSTATNSHFFFSSNRSTSCWIKSTSSKSCNLLYKVQLQPLKMRRSLQK